MCHAIGDNAAGGAASSASSVARVRFAVMVLAAGSPGSPGCSMPAACRRAKYTLGETDLMTVIAAVIVGGTLLNGGKGTIVGALVGSLLMGMLNNGLILMGLSRLRADDGPRPHHPRRGRAVAARKGR